MKLIWLASLALGLCACAPAAPEASAGGPPTIVSLNPCADAILTRVTAPGQLLAISHYSKDPAATSMPMVEAARFAHTGGTVEEILALKPDVVVASAFLAPATRAALTDLGIRIHVIGMAATVDEAREQLKELAQLSGDPAAGDALIARIDEAVAASKTNAPPIKALVWQQGGIVPGEATLIDDLLTRTGFASQTEARGLSQASHVSLEAMLADPPDLILAAGSGRAQDHPALASLSDIAIFELPSRLLYCGGPTVIEAAEYLRSVREAHTAGAKP